MLMQTLRLKPGADKRLRGGHLWIYSNEVDTKMSPLKMFGIGQQVVVENDRGKELGVAYLNPNNLICGRIISRDSKKPLNRSLLVHRLKIALSLREMNFDQPCYRLIYGDSDGLPGLVIDRYFDVVAVQVSSAGMEAVLDDIIDALHKVLQPSAIVLRNDGKMREMEGLETYTDVVHGDIPDLCPLIENGVNLMAPLLKGQKTGWFYDHRESRAKVNQVAQGKRVLDLFSYVGGWGIQAMASGAEEVVCVDASHYALDVARENARLNNGENRFTGLHGDAFEACKALVDERERFDIVVCDPPAFIQKKKDIRNGERAYARINNLAMRLLNKGGVLVSASCSMHYQRESLVDMIRANSRELDRTAQIFHVGYQGADHPIHPAIPETDYLKAYFARILPAG